MGIDPFVLYLTGLKELYLASQMDEEALRHLRRLTSLERLLMFDYNISGMGLLDLGKVESLKFLYLPRRTPRDSIRTIQKALPNCEIEVF